MTSWMFVRFRNGMDHCVVADLVPMILLGMVLVEEPGAFVRGAAMPDDPRPPTTEGPVEIATRFTIDLPGTCYQHRPWEEIEFEGLTFSMPSEDLRPLLRTWSQRPPDDYCGIPFYRFCGNVWRCLVLLPAQRDALIALLEARAEAAENRAAAFYETRKPPQAAFRAINESLGVPKGAVYKGAPIYGHDERERFDPDTN